MPRNAKQRRANCYNPIFTPGIFSGVDTWNEAAQNKLVWPDTNPRHQNDLKTRSGVHFSEFDQGWPSLTKFDQVWPRCWPSRVHPTGAHRTKRNSKWGPKHISQSLEGFDQVWPSLTKIDQVWPRFDQTVDQTESWTRLTTPWSMCRAWWEVRFNTLRVKNRQETRELWAKPWESGPTFCQILLSIVDKTAYLGGSVCAWILSNRWQLGPQAETFKQEGYFNYDVQLPDRQELLRSSRNLNQKTTP